MSVMQPKSWFPKYTAIDIAGIAGFSVVAGIVFAILSHIIAPIAFGLGGHLGIGAIYGLWFIGGTMVGYIIRKPGAAFLGETIGSFVELLLVSPYAILLYYYGPAQGIMSELAFALNRYKRWGYRAMMLAGVLPVIAAYPFDIFVSPFYPAARYPGYPLELHVALIIAYSVSGALLGGVLVRMVVNAAVKAGALRRWPVSAERK
jgi:energy-coupling factor transport system substrate-specific component